MILNPPLDITLYLLLSRPSSFLFSHRIFATSTFASEVVPIGISIYIAGRSVFNMCPCHRFFRLLLGAPTKSMKMNYYPSRAALLAFCCALPRDVSTLPQPGHAETSKRMQAFNLVASEILAQHSRLAHRIDECSHTSIYTELLLL